MERFLHHQRFLIHFSNFCSLCQGDQTDLLFDIWFMLSKIIPTAVQLVTGFSKASLCSGLLVHLSSSASACHFLISSVNGEQEMWVFFFPTLKYLGVHQKAVIISHKFGRAWLYTQVPSQLDKRTRWAGFRVKRFRLDGTRMRLSSLEYLTSSRFLGFFFFFF